MSDSATLAALAEQLIYQRCAADPTLVLLAGTPWPSEAPEGVPYPFLVYDQLFAESTTAPDGYVIGGYFRYQVKAIDEGRSKDRTDPIMARVAAALNGARAAPIGASGWVGDARTRGETVSMTTFEAQTWFVHQGAEFELWVTHA